MSLGLWPCGSHVQNASADVDLSLCIATSKVCDGFVGIKDNNCIHGEDEHAVLCRYTHICCLSNIESKVVCPEQK